MTRILVPVSSALAPSARKTPDAGRDNRKDRTTRDPREALLDLVLSYEDLMP